MNALMNLSRSNPLPTAGELLAGFEPAAGAWRDLPVAGIVQDSRRVVPGALFAARRGSRGHGLDHLDEAIAKGAVLVVAEPGGVWNEQAIARAARGLSVPLLMLPDLGRHLSALAARFYGEPARRLRTLGATGTNGKTSVSHFLACAMPEKWRCALVGTLGNGFPEALAPATHTTPDAVEAQRILADLVAQGARALAMEVSSHALDQHRVEAIPFHTAVFTNLSREHLDYHGSMRAYGEAKGRLFERPELELAVINSDDDFGAGLIESLAGRVRRIACHGGGRTLGAEEFVRLESLRQTEKGVELEVATSWGRARIRSRLLGEFNAQNLLLVLGVLLGWGVPLDEAVLRLEKLRGVPGRMQRLGGGDRPLVVVDYAHSPDALQRALTSLRAHTQGRLWCVFGCGGDRDRGKRPQMGRIAEALADRVIVTDDNPRHEPSPNIIADILEGMEAPAQAHVIPDRAWAIATALAEAEPGDVVLIAGKGHETWQQIGDERQPFNDYEQVKRWLREGA